MKYFYTFFSSLLCSFLLTPLGVSALNSTDKSKLYKLEHSTFNPTLRGEISEQWDYSRIEHSTFNPDFRGTTSQELDDTRLEESTFNPDFQGKTSKELNKYKLKHSTFNPDFRGETVEEFNEHSTFDPDFQGKTSKELDDKYRLEHSTFNPAYYEKKYLSEVYPKAVVNNRDKVLTIKENFFSGRIRAVRPHLPSIRANFNVNRSIPRQ
ncbi:hypothetical protein K9M41_01690 [Candidatus Gracilibacteria bacterium]|nr:hypothetical protein [Candidatus Gracilibacteria bacterium]